MKKIVTVIPYVWTQFLKDVQYCRKSGSNTIRVNTSKCNDENSFFKCVEFINKILEIDEELEVIVDIPYPKIKPRVYFDEQWVEIKKGKKYEVYYNKAIELMNVEKYFNINQEKFASNVKINDRVFYSDGQGCFIVKNKVNETCVVLEAENDFIMYASKSLSFDCIKGNKEMCLDAIRRLIFKNRISIALSFVETKKEIEIIRSEGIDVISKIENEKGIENLEEIIKSSQGIMVARGDLGIHADYRKIFSYEKYIIGKAKKMNRECYVATDILDTLENRFLPSRADLIDIYQIKSMQPNGLILNYRQIKNRTLDRAIKIICEMEECTENENITTNY